MNPAASRQPPAASAANCRFTAPIQARTNHRLPTGGSGRRPVVPHPSSFILLAATLLVAACGFQLRGTAPLPFASLYVQAPVTSQLAVQLRRAVRATDGTRLADTPEEAQVILQITNELTEKKILSLSGGGRVSEYELRYRVAFRLTDSKNREHIPASELLLRRDFSFNDEQALAKEHEERLLYRHMRDDAVQQLVRRLQAAQLKS
jgi:LPS-assembly lipoprotein